MPIKEYSREVVLSAHKACCPYKASKVGSCSVNKLPEAKEGTCEGECYYMNEFKRQLRKANNAEE